MPQLHPIATPTIGTLTLSDFEARFVLGALKDELKAYEADVEGYPEDRDLFYERMVRGLICKVQEGFGL